MGDENQFTYVRSLADDLAGPYLEVGSKNYGSTQDLRSLFSAKGTYVGVDMEAGNGVDVVLDMTRDFDEVDAGLNGQRFGTVFCLSVLEHCEQPFRMAENLTRLLAADGKVCVSVPFAWKFHGYPSDYWRFTHEGVKKLFPALQFDMENSIATRPGDRGFSPLNEDIAKISFSSSYHRNRGHAVRGVSAAMFRMFSKVGLFRWLAGYRYVMAPTMVSMIGTRRAETDAAGKSGSKAA